MKTLLDKLLPAVAALALASCTCGGSDLPDPEPDPEPQPSLPGDLEFHSAEAVCFGNDEAAAASRFELILSDDDTSLHLILFAEPIPDGATPPLPAKVYLSDNGTAPGTIQPGTPAGSKIDGSYFKMGDEPDIAVKTCRLSVRYEEETCSITGALDFADETKSAYPAYQLTFSYTGRIDVGTPAPPAPDKKSYISAAGAYIGTAEDKSASIFQIQFADRAYGDENLPVNYLFVTLACQPDPDVEHLAIEPGEYTLAETMQPLPGRFYPGAADAGGNWSGSFLANIPDAATQLISPIIGGTLSIAVEGADYRVTGCFGLEDGSAVEVSYLGAIPVENYSDEMPPADEIDLPASDLTEDLVFTPSAAEGYAAFWPGFFGDHPDKNYVYLLLYRDDQYMEFVQLGLIVDNTEYPGRCIPVGTYPVIRRTDEAFAKHDLAAIPAFSVATETNPRIDYGCWYSHDYANAQPLVAGEVEVLESDGLNVKLRFALQDNAETPHTVSGEYSGRLQDITE